MMKKLTLSADPEVIATAHRLAKEQGTSVSALFARLIRALSRQPTSPSIGHLTQRATGLIELSPSQSERDVLTDALDEKYNL